MICPRCKKYQDVLAFQPMKIIEEFQGQTAQMYKCCLCHWVFAPLPDLLPDEIGKLLEDLKAVST